MEIDRWVDGYKVRSFPWVDGKTIFFNVQYFAPGQSIEQPPVWDNTVYITDNEAGQRLVRDYLHTLVNHVSQMNIKKGYKVILTA